MVCGYCNTSEEKLKLCQLSPNPRSKIHEWQYPKWICKSCRKYLKNAFRLCPKDVAEKYGF